MNTLIGFTFGTIAGLIAITLILPKQTVIEHQTEYVIQTVVHEKVAVLEFDELRDQITNLTDDLYQECLKVIERHTDDPMPGIIRHVDRHYQGDSCLAADEAIRGGW
jgi:hypothetical protein